MNIYLAGGLFAQCERVWNRLFAAALESALPGATVVLPQDFKEHKKFANKEAFRAVYRQCIEGIEKCDAVVAILEGPDADSGTAYEVGYAAALKKPIIGVRTDFRPSQEAGMNLMLSRGCTRIVLRPSWDENVEGLARDVARALKRIK